jgi:hypothetical protein
MLTAAGCAGSTASGPVRPVHPCGHGAAPRSTYRHVLWIWMENKPYDQIIGSQQAPFTNELARSCGLATSYRAVTHPSLPNYIGATSGSTWGIHDDEAPSSHRLDAPSIYGQLAAAGRTWREYEENAPGNCPRASHGRYAVKHDPAAYYVRIRRDCERWDVPMGSTAEGNLRHDLDAGTLPAFAFLTPDLCHDTHDCSVSTGDAWLQTWLRVIVASPAYRAGSTAVFLTYDEGDDSSGNRVVTIVVSRSTPPGTRSRTPFTHYSLLRTTEELLGLGSFLGQAASAPSMRRAFGL